VVVPQGGVELANLAGDTLDDITAAAERGIQRIRHTTGHPRRKSTDCSSILRRPSLLDGGSMATIPFIEHGPGVGRQPPDLLAPSPACGGVPTPLAACLLLRRGSCLLADAAELLVFACRWSCRFEVAHLAAS
jgi:hypothetical protein